MQPVGRRRKGVPKRLKAAATDQQAIKQMPYLERWVGLLEEIKVAEDKREELMQLQPGDELFETFAKDRVNGVDEDSDGEKEQGGEDSDVTSGSDIEDELDSEEEDANKGDDGDDDDDDDNDDDALQEDDGDKLMTEEEEDEEEEDQHVDGELEEDEDEDDHEPETEHHTVGAVALLDNSTDPTGEKRARIEVEKLVRAMPTTGSHLAATSLPRARKQVAMWTEHIDALAHRAHKLQDHLEKLGFDSNKFLSETVMTPMCEAQMQNDDDRAARSKVTERLNRDHPVEIASSTNESFMQHLIELGAQEALTREDVDVLESVDILDETVDPLANDKLREADYLQVFQRSTDNKDCPDEDDKPAQRYGFGAATVGAYVIPVELVQKLKSHQVKAVSFIVNRLDQNKGSLVAHACGLGKTISTLSAIFVYARRRQMLGQHTLAAVVCPKSVMLQWVSECETWQPQMNAMILANLNEDTVRRTVAMWHKLGGLLVMGHDQFESISTRLGLQERDGVLVIDEAHVLKSTKHTKLHQAVADSVKRLILLTGTPLQNSLDEYYQLIELVSPGLLADSLTQFQQRFTAPIVNGQWLDSSPRDVRDSTVLMYALLSLAREAMDDCSGAVLNTFLPRKREFCLMHAVDTDPNVSSACDIAELHRVHTHGMKQKLALVLRLTTRIRAEHPNDRIVIFSVKVDHLEKCNKMIPGFLYTGSITSIEQREEIISNFKKTPGSIIYMSTLAGGVGLNLADANRMIIINSSWNPMDDEQAIARVYRLGQQKDVFVYRLVAHGGLETRVYRQGIMKRSIAAQLSSDKDATRLFKEEEMRTFETGQQWTPLTQADVATVDPVLAKDMDTTLYHVHDHDAHFKPFEDPSEEIKEMALNKRHALERENAYRLLPQKGVSTSAIFYESDDPEPTLKLVPPWPPVLARDETRFLSEPASSTDKAAPLYDLVTRIPVDSADEARVSVGPALVRDMPQSFIDSGNDQLELVLERATSTSPFEDEDTDAWKPFRTERILQSQLVGTRMKCNDIFLPTGMLSSSASKSAGKSLSKRKREQRETIVKFRACYVVKNASTGEIFMQGPWSASSAPLRCI